MTRNIFKGLGIALITPFNDDGSVDYDSLTRLVAYQLKNGCDFLCILATTGETPCLTSEEKTRIKDSIVQQVNGRVPILMGCGGNNTAEVVNTLKTADFKGIDGILSVCPYYNKPSQEGLYQHFMAIANASPVPVILYNVPGRVGINMTGKEVAEKMLRDNGITDVKVTCTKGHLTDHYNPADKTVNLSESVYSSAAVAAAAVAAHECGHAIQHAKGYAPLKLRSAMVPIVSFANNTVQWVLLIGVLLINLTPALLWAGIALFAVTTVFSIVTLPVELNASSRAVEWLEFSGLTNWETSPLAKDALKWAAYTYVIAALGSLATLLYYIGMAERR